MGKIAQLLSAHVRRRKRMKKFTCDYLIQKLKEFAEKEDTVHISKQMVDRTANMPGSATFSRYFGSWSNALASAQLKTGTITGRPQDPPITLNENALDVIVGELLGDGSLDASPTVNACFAHSTTNWNYSDFVRQALCACGIPLSEEFLPARNNGKPQKRTRSASNITFGELRRTWYPQGTKIVPVDLFLNRTRCLHWYLGDGYIDQDTVMFSTCGFTEGEVERLAVLLTSLGFKSTRNKRSRGYHIVRISRTDAHGFLDWIGPCPVIGYEHKWNLKSPKAKISKEQMLVALRASMENSGTLSRTAFDTKGEFSSSTAIRLFGSWREAKDSARNKGEK